MMVALLKSFHLLEDWVQGLIPDIPVDSNGNMHPNTGDDQSLLDLTSCLVIGNQESLIEQEKTLFGK